MAKKFFILTLTILFPIFSNLFSGELPHINFSCPNGGNILIQFQMLADDFSAGEATLQYENCSIFENSLYNGSIMIDFSLSKKENKLWIDFVKDSHFTLSYNNQNFEISFPYTIEFYVKLPAYSPEGVSILCDNCNDKPYILINNQKFYIEKYIIYYLLPFK